MFLPIPILAIAFSGLACSLTFAFAKPTSKLRLTTSFFSAGLTFIFHVSLHGTLENRLWKALATTCMWIQWLKSFDDLCLTRVSFENEHKDVGANRVGPVANGGVQAPHTDCRYAGHRARFNWALGMLWNMRGIGTQWGIKNIPLFSQADKSYVPSRGRFIVQHLLVLLITFVILDAFSHQTPDAETMILLSVQKQHLLSRYSEVTHLELIIRASIVLSFWLNTVCTVAMIHSTLAIIHVGLFISDPVQWPPIFGSISQMYTVRQFWGYVYGPR